jgi:hypothetical protein
MTSKEKEIINISEEQRQNLVDEIANLVANFKKDENVECIYFAPYKGLGNIEGNVIEFTVVIKGYSKKITQEFSKCDKCLKEHDLIRKLGIKIHVNADNSEKYTTLPLNPSEILRANCLFNSVILFDRTGEYTKIKRKAQEYKNVENSKMFYYDNLAEFYPPIDEEIEMQVQTNDVKEFTKAKTFQFVKNML